MVDGALSATGRMMFSLPGIGDGGSLSGVTGRKDLKICVVKVGAIGDVIMTTPFVRALRKTFPDARIDYWVGGWSKAILADNPHIDNIESFEDDVFFKKDLGGVLRTAKRIKRAAYDLCFVCDHSYLSNLFAYLTGIPVRVGFDKLGGGYSLTRSVRYHEVRHEVEYYLALLEPFTDETFDRDLEVSLSADEENFARRFLKENRLRRPVIGIAPGGARNPGQTMDSRRWMPDRYSGLTSRLAEKHHVVLFGGPGDDDVGRLILEGAGRRVHSLIGKCSLKEAVAVMSRCEVVVANDSGPMHMAAASGTKVLSIFGPTDPRRKAPLGDRHEYIWKEDVPCAPCELFGHFPVETDMRCMKAISVDEVAEKVKGMLTG